jgi:twitching motility protein PilT
VQSDVVRVSERTQGADTLVVVGIKFRRSLTLGECERLDIRAPSIPAGVTAPAAESSPFAGTTNIRALMIEAMQAGATDLHIKVGSPPRLRMSGTLLNVGNQPLSYEQTHAMALDLMTREQAARFEREGDVELASTIENVGRFRVNVLRQRGTSGLVIRCIPDKVPTIAELNLNSLSETLAERPRGLVLVTGPTGSGKSTTLAALVNHINHTRACHIITMEDPIEYFHTDVEAHITQREIGRDAKNFTQALRRALRQDPDVIMVGEMRDLETISLALTAAETGHLVFATLHTSSAVMTPGRIVDVFPAGQQTQIRMQLADSLQGIMAQMLLPRRDGVAGMVVAQEVLVATEAVRSLIRERKTPQIANMMQTGAKDGMRTLEASLNDLVRRGVVSYDVAVSRANFPKQIKPREGSR